MDKRIFIKNGYILAGEHRINTANILHYNAWLEESDSPDGKQVMLNGTEVYMAGKQEPLRLAGVDTANLDSILIAADIMNIGFEPSYEPDADF